MIHGNEYDEQKPIRNDCVVERVIVAVQPDGFMEDGIRYTEVTDIVMLSPWDAGHKHCLRLMFADGSSVLLQVRSKFFTLVNLHHCRKMQINYIVF